VHYGSDVKALDGLRATPENKERLRAWIDGIWDDGGTNIGEALSTARDLLASARGDYRVNRLILVSDGQPTEGVTDTAGLLGIVRGVRALGISVSSLGVGDDFNEHLMQALSEVGAGAYGYLQDAAQLSSIFKRDLDAAGTQVARAVTLGFRVPAGASLQQVLGHSQVTRAGDLVTVALPDFSAGQQERVVVHFSVVGAVDGQAVELSQVELRYADLRAGADVASQATLATVTSGDAAVVAQGRDKDAVVFANRARAAQNSREAAELLVQGDRGGAEKLFDQNQVLFDEAGAVAGASAVQADLDQNGAMRLQAREAKSEAALKVYKKKVETRARRDFGLMGSTY
jgi:Ca-activated chloride channel family protein